MPAIQIPEKLLPFLEKHKRFKIAIGGRGGAKSQSFSDMLIMESQTKGCKIGCFREFQNSIDDSVLSLLEAEIERIGVEGFDIQKTAINNESGGGFRFKGLARNPESVKSMYGFQRFWVEEGQTISEKSMKLLTPTLRAPGSEVWISANPMSRMDPFSQRFIEPFKKELDEKGYYEDDLHLIVVINYLDNPWFPEELEQERQWDYENLPRAEYDHVWLGKYNDTVAGAIIKPEWFDAAIDAHKVLGFEPVGCKVVSHDPSDSGDDPKGLVVRHGSVILDADENAVLDVNDGGDWASERAIQERADVFVWDANGIGASLRRQFNTAMAAKKIELQEFVSQGAVHRPNEIYEDVRDIDGAQDRKPRTNKQTFKNRRAQYYWALRDRFYRTYLAVEKNKKVVDPDLLISISSSVSKLEQLRSEVCRIPRKHNPAGLIQLMSKPEMLNLRISSPNIADALAMSLVVPENVESVGKIEFDSLW